MVVAVVALGLHHKVVLLVTPLMVEQVVQVVAVLEQVLLVMFKPMLQLMEQPTLAVVEEVLAQVILLRLVDQVL
jgi:hypothetical protein